MIVISVTNAPPKMRGDLSKWLFEISTGVYVGKLPARVRDELWERLCQNIVCGTATMVYTCKNEQGFDFKVHNCSWEPIDLDGFKVMRHPVKNQSSSTKINSEPTPYTSKERNLYTASTIEKSLLKKQNDLVFLDIETTGLNLQTDSIIEISYILIEGGDITKRDDFLFSAREELSSEIINLTGLTNAYLIEHATDVKKALEQIAVIFKNRTVIAHNASFDLGFLRRAFQEYGIKCPPFKVKDTVAIAKRKLPGLNNYKLDTLLDYFSLPERTVHRALTDCDLTMQIYLKLFEVK